MNKREATDILEQIGKSVRHLKYVIQSIYSGKDA